MLRNSLWAMTGSNRRPSPCKGAALPAELIARKPAVRSSFAQARLGPSLAAAAFALGLTLGPLQAPAALPPWLVLRPGVAVRVALAPWVQEEAPEAGLTLGAASLRADFTGEAGRPSDVVPEPVGVRARVIRALPHGIVLVHGIGSRWQAYALRTSLVPEVPAGVRLRAAGGFGGFADFYPTLASPQRSAEELPSGTKLVSLTMGVAPFDPDTADLVRVSVRVLAGPFAKRTGWVAVGYTGLPVAKVPLGASPADRACACRALTFADLP